VNCHLCTARPAAPSAHGNQVMHCGHWLLYTGRPTHVLHRIGNRPKIVSATCRKQAFTVHRSKAKTTPGFNSDRKIRPYAHGLLPESPFVPSSTDCWAVRAKIRQNCHFGGHSGETGSRNRAATKKINFLTLVSYSLLQTVFG